MARSRRRTQAPPPQRLILDSGAVIALSRNDLRARATLAAAREAGVEVSIPSVVVAETVRGSAKDAKVNRVIKSVGEVTAADERTGRGAGALLGAAFYLRGRRPGGRLRDRARRRSRPHR